MSIAPAQDSATETETPAAEGPPTPSPMSGARKPPADDSAGLKAAEAATLVIVHGCSMADALNLSGADPKRARQRMKRAGTLPYVPTPAMIAEECRRLRRWPLIACNSDGE